jgi:teichoic acid transport system ATP-binding protein
MSFGIDFNAKNDAIVFQNVAKRYKLYKSDKHRFLGTVFGGVIPHKEKKVFSNLSFKIQKGESVGILGKNGAGKSTILKMITGVTYPTEGQVIVNGKVSALLELTSGFDPETTGRENIYFKGYLMGFTKKQIEEKIDEIIEFSELGEYIDQPIRTYSSGMKARLGFAISANIEPDILIIDEALSVGDSKFSKKCNKKVKEIQDSGATILFVSHSTKAIKSFCDKCMLLQNGKLVTYGDTEEVIQLYNDIIK